MPEASNQHVAERTFDAMSTSAHIMIAAPITEVQRILTVATERVAELEDRWSRFRPHSEISAINAAEGAPTSVSIDTIALVEKSIQAWQLTDGAFDPTVLNAMLQTGYDRTFAEIKDHHSFGSATPASGCLDIIVDRRNSTVRMPPGVGFDPGGIGKGLAADLIAAEAINSGATGVLINLGGDLVTAGKLPDEEGWTIDITENTVGSTPIARLAFTHGAVATSVTTRRVWGPEGDRRHHLIDPTTGTPADAGVLLVSVLATEGWLAEAATKAYHTGKVSRAVASIPTLVVHVDGSLMIHGGMQSYIVPSSMRQEEAP